MLADNVIIRWYGRTGYQRSGKCHTPCGRRRFIVPPFTRKAAEGPGRVGTAIGQPMTSKRSHAHSSATMAAIAASQMAQVLRRDSHAVASLPVEILRPRSPLKQAHEAHWRMSSHSHDSHGGDCRRTGRPVVKTGRSTQRQAEEGRDKAASPPTASPLRPDRFTGHTPRNWCPPWGGSGRFHLRLFSLFGVEFCRRCSVLLEYQKSSKSQFRRYRRFG